MNLPMESLADNYLARLQAEASDLPSDVREDLVANVRETIDETLSRPGATRTDLLNLFERLGDPAQLVEAARGGAPQPAHHPVPIFVSIAALVITPLVWPIGVILLWIAPDWTVRQKLLGSLVVPGGLFAVYSVASRIDLNQRCWGHIGPTGRAVVDACQPPDAVVALVHGGLYVALLAPVLAMVYLAFVLVRARRAGKFSASSLTTSSTW